MKKAFGVLQRIGKALMLPVALLPVLGNLGIANSTFSDTDFAVLGLFLGKVQEFIGGVGLTGVLIGILVIMIILRNKKI